MSACACESGHLRVLRIEHQRLAYLTEALEVFLVRLRLGESPSDLVRFTSILDPFLSQWHHPREKRVVFAQARRLGVEIEQLMSQHAEIEGLLRVLHQLGLRSAEWTPTEARMAQRAGRSLLGLLSFHCSNEDLMLFPSLEANLSCASLSQLDEQLLVGVEGEVEPTAEMTRTAARLVVRYTEATLRQPEGSKPTRQA